MLVHSWGLSDKVDIRKTAVQPQSYLAYCVVGPHRGSWKRVQALMCEVSGSAQRSRIHILSRHYRVEEEEQEEDFMVKGSVQLDESW